MLLLIASSFSATLINKDVPYKCSQSYLEGDLALNDGYVVVALENKNWPNTFWTISIFTSDDRGNTWVHAKDLIGTFDDGWIMDTSRYAIVDPSVSIMGDSSTGFYLIGMVSLKDTVHKDSKHDSVLQGIFCPLLVRQLVLLQHARVQSEEEG